ncbi:GntR family transcriptional regulator [Flavihumibacter profundi]|jgi:DNA-binding transcriptional regulator YhcF (GntR family)|uniref:GntR family transcriptional regulator n=1 Tax=Flavihumibacter profundi TaxID=2716883 RepID=UPI001CC455C5|nr:GntR family transcriptional regulator [Flavihumibacter profundi]MBZ5855523.1 GntR family transcriptional regulator [Flavihumibacter profundi]
MATVFQKIKELEKISSFSKHDSLVQGIINAIDDTVISKNDTLPSVNTMIRELHYSRETVMKGYRELVSRGIIESKNRLGYFVSGGNTLQMLKVALVMYNLDTFEEQFYRNFRDTLGKEVDVQIFFHHGNIDIFETILQRIKGHFGIYVIAPIPHPRSKELLETVPGNKLLMFDRYEPISGEFSHITQEFEASSFKVFSELADNIKKFGEIVFIHSPDSLDPKEIVTAFKRFLKKYKIKGSIIPEFVPGSVRKGTVYFTLDNFIMWEILKECVAKKLKPGKDVGILSHNDEPAKNFVGITTYSADFGEMGRLAANAILHKEKVQLTVPMNLFRRKTL